MTDRELFAQAVVALEYHTQQTRSISNTNLAIEALRARLATEQDEGHCQACDGNHCTAKNGCVALDNPKAQPEPEPVAWKDAPSKIYLQICEESNCDQPFDSHIEVSWCQDKINDSDIPYVRADIAISQPPEQEPAVWIKKDRTSVEFSIMSADYMMKEGFDPLYTAPPQREWQRLTDEEYTTLMQQADHDAAKTGSVFQNLRYAIEAKLKEKNA